MPLRRQAAPREGRGEGEGGEGGGGAWSGGEGGESAGSRGQGLEYWRFDGWRGFEKRDAVAGLWPPRLQPSAIATSHQRLEERAHAGGGRPVRRRAVRAGGREGWQGGGLAPPRSALQARPRAGKTGARQRPEGHCLTRAVAVEDAGGHLREQRRSNR